MARIRRRGGPRGDARGFTLIEMLVVIGIILLMLSLGGVALMQFLSAQKTRLALGNVSSLIRMGRQFAVSKRRRCWIEFRRKDGETPAQALLYAAEASANPDTGRLEWWICMAEPLKTMEMPPEVDFALVPGKTTVNERNLGQIERTCLIIYSDGTCEGNPPEDEDIPACYGDNPEVPNDPADGTSKEEFKINYRYKIVLQNRVAADVGIIFVPPRTVSMKELYLVDEDAKVTLVDPDGSGVQLFPPEDL